MLIEPTTSAVTSTVKVKRGTTIQVRGTIGTDVIPIEIPDGSTGWVQLVEDFDNVQLDANHLQITAQGGALIRINKPATSSAVGVAILVG